MMILSNPIMWAVSKWNNWKFQRAFRLAPIKLLGDMYVKEVYGNLYAVDIEVIPAKVTR